MSSPFQFDVGFEQALKTNGLASFVGAPPLPLGDIEARRKRLKDLSILRSRGASIAPNITIKDYTTTSADGAEVLLRLYRPAAAGAAGDPHATASSIPGPTAAVIFVHGGGYMASSINDYDFTVANYAASTSLTFLNVDYRLAPEHPYPAALNDVCASLEWLHSHVSELNIDPERIILMGSSAGAGLVAATAILIQRQKQQQQTIHQQQKLKIAKQVLIAPMLDPQNSSPPNDPAEAAALAKTLSWNFIDNATAWQAYLGGSTSTASIKGESDALSSSTSLPPETAAPSLLKSAKGMPPLYLEVGSLDIFAAEDIRYALKHVEAGIPVEMHVLAGLPHSYDSLGTLAEVVRDAKARRVKAILEV